jgi:hypothetical protein
VSLKLSLCSWRTVVRGSEDHVPSLPSSFRLILTSHTNKSSPLVVRPRCTVQQENHAWLRATAESAKEHSLNSISFLAVDATSDAFNHPQGWTQRNADSVILDTQQVDALEKELEDLIHECRSDLDSGFVVESPAKLRRIVQQFRVYLGQAQAVAPRCNAPWVSAVVPAFGNIHNYTLEEIVNSPPALRFRR